MPGLGGPAEQGAGELRQHGQDDQGDKKRPHLPAAPLEAHQPAVGPFDLGGAPADQGRRAPAGRNDTKKQDEIQQGVAQRRQGAALKGQRDTTFSMVFPFAPIGWTPMVSSPAAFPLAGPGTSPSGRRRGFADDVSRLLLHDASAVKGQPVKRLLTAIPGADTRAYGLAKGARMTMVAVIGLGVGASPVGRTGGGRAGGGRGAGRRRPPIGRFPRPSGRTADDRRAAGPDPGRPGTGGGRRAAGGGAGRRRSAVFRHRPGPSRTLRPRGLDLYPNVTAVAAAAARLKRPWQDLPVVSLHGRTDPTPLFAALARSGRALVLTDAVRTPAAVATAVRARAGDRFAMTVLKIWACRTSASASCRSPEAADCTAAPLNVVWLEAERPPEVTLTLGLPDEALLRPDGVFTKLPARALALAALAPRPGDVVYDVGAGVGTVAVEASLLNPGGPVFAVEARSRAPRPAGRQHSPYRRPHRDAPPGRGPGRPGRPSRSGPGVRGRRPFRPARAARRPDPAAAARGAADGGRRAARFHRTGPVGAGPAGVGPLPDAGPGQPGPCRWPGTSICAPKIPCAY